MLIFLEFTPPSKSSKCSFLKFVKLGDSDQYREMGDENELDILRLYILQSYNQTYFFLDFLSFFSGQKNRYSDVNLVNCLRNSIHARAKVRIMCTVSPAKGHLKSSHESLQVKFSLFRPDP